MTEIKTEDERVDLRAIITKHVVVGGYPNTMGIARDAFELGRHLSHQDELVEALEKLQPVACGDWCREGKHIPECERARSLLTRIKSERDG